MTVNADKPHLWKADTRASVDQFNQWFMSYAPKAYRDNRAQTVEDVERGLSMTEDLTEITASILQKEPAILQMLRMSTCPPLARDRLIGLADLNKNLVKVLESGKLPPQLAPALLGQNLGRITDIILQLLDIDIFPWIAEKRRPSQEERYRSSTIVADRLSGAVAEPIVRNAQEKRQLGLIEKYLVQRGYKKEQPPRGQSLDQMSGGTFTFRYNVKVRNSKTEGKTVNIPIDAVIQPKAAKLPCLPILIEAKSSGDYTNVNKRRKEEGKKMSQLQASYGNQVVFVLFLCGYFDGGYLGYSAFDGIDWIWEHRPEDLDQLGF